MTFLTNKNVGDGRRLLWWKSLKRSSISRTAIVSWTERLVSAHLQMTRPFPFYFLSQNIALEWNNVCRTPVIKNLSGFTSSPRWQKSSKLKTHFHCFYSVSTFSYNVNLLKFIIIGVLVHSWRKEQWSKPSLSATAAMMIHSWRRWGNEREKVLSVATYLSIFRWDRCNVKIDVHWYRFSHDRMEDHQRLIS